LPLQATTRKEAEIRFRVLAAIAAFLDDAPESSLRQGIFFGDKNGFEKLLGPSGLFIRTGLVKRSQKGELTRYGRTELGIKWQDFYKETLDIDDYTRSKIGREGTW